ncbi:MAG: hypothetical protein QOJ90_755 [Actinomycetota bacterium]|jgi:diguanylate cyclase (GGDEF)-like protein|nr:hypothetical protein [Actinomycetota bacterium]
MRRHLSVSAFEVQSPGGPFVEAGAGRRMLPFVTVALGAIAILAVTDLEDLAVFLFALVCAASLFTAAILIPWRRLPVAAQDVPVLAFFVVIAQLRDAGGGGASGVGPMVLLPVCWIAMYGRRSALVAALVATGAVFVVPWALIGGSGYPASEPRRGAVLMLVAGLVGLAVQSLVRTLEDQRVVAALAARQVARSAEQLAAVAHVRHTMLVKEDPREALCQGAMDLTGAQMGMLLEPAQGGGIRVTASVGADLLHVTVPMDPARSAAVECLLTGRRLFIPDAGIDRRIPVPLREQTNAASLLYEPVVRRGQVVAVLLVGWAATVELGDDTAAAISLMAMEASVALEQAELLRSVHDLARTDQLTGGPNRRAFDEMLPEVLNDASSTSPVCVALLDLDHFKKYNDAHGHPGGDRLLQQATKAWTRQLKGTDVLARYGGEEFVVVLRNCLIENAVVVLDKLRDATPYDQTVSIGIAQWDGNESQQALIQRADEALYRAKSAGRNRLYCAA